MDMEPQLEPHYKRTKHRYEVVLSSNLRTGGTAPSPKFAMQPPLKSVVRWRIKSAIIPWLSGAAPDPAPYYGIRSTHLSAMTAHHFMASCAMNQPIGVKDLILTVMNKGIIGRNHVFKNNKDGWNYVKHQDIGEIDLIICGFNCQPLGGAITFAVVMEFDCDEYDQTNTYGFM